MDTPLPCGAGVSVGVIPCPPLGELEGAEPASNKISRPALCAASVSENFSGGRAGGKVWRH